MHSLFFSLTELATKNGLKKKLKPVLVTPTELESAHNRTMKFVVLELATGKYLTILPGNFKGWVEDVYGNYKSVMSRRSTYPNKDVPIYCSRWEVRYILLAKNKSNVNY